MDVTSSKIISLTFAGTNNVPANSVNEESFTFPIQFKYGVNVKKIVLNFQNFAGNGVEYLGMYTTATATFQNANYWPENPLTSTPFQGFASNALNEFVFPKNQLTAVTLAGDLFLKNETAAAIVASYTLIATVYYD